MDDIVNRLSDDAILRIHQKLNTFDNDPIFEQLSFLIDRKRYFMYKYESEDVHDADEIAAKLLRDEEMQEEIERQRAEDYLDREREAVDAYGKFWYDEEEEKRKREEEIASTIKFLEEQEEEEEQERLR